MALSGKVNCCIKKILYCLQKYIGYIYKNGPLLSQIFL